MPRAAQRPCTYPGCGRLTDGGRCEAHRYQVRRSAGGAAAMALYDYRWHKARKRFLAQHPLCQCEECKEGELRITPAEVVDHRIPHRGDRALFWDSDNWQAMSKACHDRKTAREDGGFGNRRGRAL